MGAPLDQTTHTDGGATAARLRVEIQGAVQGVGFRPFVYRLATEAGLAGWVLNDSAGVFLEVEGDRPALERFLARLRAEAPPRATIQSLAAAWLGPAGHQGFSIRHSAGGGAKTVQVLPDIATCPECLAETLDPAERRHGYPFTNCTNCGPRFTIVEALPYDRPNTTMRGFPLCPRCRAEYEDPLDRRFHAQPVACPECGPRLELWGAAPAETQHGAPAETQNLASLPAHRPLALGDEALARAAAAIRAGQIVAVKGLGGFHLMCDARDEAAVALLRARKGRPTKPLALMVRDLEMAAALCELPRAAADLLAAPEAPIVLLQRRGPGESGQPAIAEGVAPGNPTLGLMLPATPLHHLLLRELGFPVVATSGNLSDEPICTDEGEAAARLGGVADLLLAHNRPIARHADDSVAALLLGEPRLLRRARGYAPAPVLLRAEAPSILALGAHLKSSVALSVGRQVFISQHIGDLDTPEARAAYERVIADFLQLYEARPAAIAHDMHPGYYSTQVARDMQRAGAFDFAISIQHHHAHLAALLAEQHEPGPALGVIWDGTGYGPDGTIWGGEFLLGDQADSDRAAHLRPFPLPGGDSAAREPRRVALALLRELYGPAALDGDELPAQRAFAPAERGLLRQMIERGLNTIPTSSAGRLFDGVSALLGLCQRSSFEGEAAMLLEFAADPHEAGAYPVELAGAALDWRPTLDALLEDRRRGVEPGRIAGRFHNSMVAAMLAVARQVGHRLVALSGGCFQNRLLAERAARALEAAGHTVLLHRHVPPNDGGVSLGQAAAAAARLQRMS